MTPLKFTVECITIAAYFYGLCWLLPLAFDIVTTL